MIHRVAGVVLLCAPAVADTRPLVEAALAEMSRAVLAADQPAFMACLAPVDSFFTTEWTHWSDQLREYTPVQFSMTVGDGPAKFEATIAEFPLEMAWRITSGPKDSWGAGGELRRVKFPTVTLTFADPDGDGPRPSRWLFAGEKWEKRECDGFSIWYFPGSEKVVHEVFQAFPVAKAHDDEGFGVSPPPQVLKLYTDMDHLKATVYLNMPDHYLGGWSEMNEGVKFMTTYTSGVENWTNAYTHEYGHVCTWTMGPEAPRIPWWVAEGAAELAAQDFRPGYWPRLDKRKRRMAARGTLAAWDEISDYIKTKPALKGLAYTQGHHMLGYISLRWERAGRNAWLRAMAQGRTLDEATRETFGMPFAELDRQWREWLSHPANNAPAPPKREGGAGASP